VPQPVDNLLPSFSSAGYNGNFVWGAVKERGEGGVGSLKILSGGVKGFITAKSINNLILVGAAKRFKKDLLLENYVKFLPSESSFFIQVANHCVQRLLSG
jgi:hypothetical protein